MLTRLFCWLFGHKFYFKSVDTFYRGYPEDDNGFYLVPRNYCQRCFTNKPNTEILKPTPFTPEEQELIDECNENESKD